jgi:hypothetical protein
MMDLAKVLAELRAELQNLDAAIASLIRLQESGKRLGRPPELVPKLSRPGRRRGSKPPEEPSGDAPSGLGA